MIDSLQSWCYRFLSYVKDGDGLDNLNKSATFTNPLCNLFNFHFIDSMMTTRI
jgi:hypothetical protein